MLSRGNRFMAPKKEKRLLQFSEFEPEPIEWLWPGRLAAAKATLIDGDPSLGKSLMTLDLAARLTTARPLPDGFTPPGPLSAVLVGSEDDLRDTVLPRLQAAGADVTRVHTFVGRSHDGHWDRQPTFPDDCDLLQEAVEETGARLVVIDPLTAFLGAAVGSLSGPHIRRALAPLARVAAATRAALVYVRHLNKGGRGQRAIYRGTGSIAIIGAARTAFLVGHAPNEDDLRVLACTKNNLAEPPPSLGFRIEHAAPGQPIITWTGTVDVSADDLVLAAGTQYGAAMPQAKEFLEGLLRDGPCPQEEVVRAAREAGIAWRTLERAKGELGVVSNKQHTDGRHRWHWSLPLDADGPCETWAERHARELEKAQEQSDRFWADFRARHSKSKGQRPGVGDQNSGHSTKGPAAPDTQPRLSDS
jgi:hypothetical protein